MLSKLRTRFTWANVAMTLALVFAMTGGAYAAKKYLITNTKQISPKVLAQLKGAKGPAGPAGVQGPAGPAGPQGAAGAKGENGASGANGQSVTSKALAAGEGGCAEGGVEFVSASGKSTVCKGERGAKGATGSPWTAGGTLPKGATETGTWGFGPISTEGLTPVAVASFMVPLAAPLEGGAVCNGPAVSKACQVHFIVECSVKCKEQTGPPESTELIDPAVTGACLGTPAKPTATSGNLCIYALTTEHVESIHQSTGILTPEFAEGAGVSGAILAVSSKVGGVGLGSWAVTG